MTAPENWKLADSLKGMRQSLHLTDFQRRALFHAETALRSQQAQLDAEWNGAIQAGYEACLTCDGALNNAGAAAMKVHALRRPPAQPPAAPQNQQAEAVTVKPLWWGRKQGTQATTPFGMYEVVEHSHDAVLLSDGTAMSRHESSAAAKAAAQADYEARILSCLAHPAAQPQKGTRS